MCMHARLNVSHAAGIADAVVLEGLRKVDAQLGRAGGRRLAGLDVFTFDVIPIHVFDLYHLTALAAQRHARSMARVR